MDGMGICHPKKKFKIYFSIALCSDVKKNRLELTGPLPLLSLLSLPSVRGKEGKGMEEFGGEEEKKSRLRWLCLIIFDSRIYRF